MYRAFDIRSMAYVLSDSRKLLQKIDYQNLTIRNHSGLCAMTSDLKDAAAYFGNKYGRAITAQNIDLGIRQENFEPSKQPLYHFRFSNVELYGNQARNPAARFTMFAVVNKTTPRTYLDLFGSRKEAATPKGNTDIPSITIESATSA